MHSLTSFFSKYKLAIVLTGVCLLFMAMIGLSQAYQNQDDSIRYGEGKGRPGMMGKKMRQPPVRVMPLKEKPSKDNPPVTNPDNQPPQSSPSTIIEDPPTCKYQTTDGYQICHPPRCLDNNSDTEDSIAPCGQCDSQKESTDRYTCMMP